VINLLVQHIHTKDLLKKVHLRLVEPFDLQPCFGLLDHLTTGRFPGVARSGFDDRIDVVSRRWFLFVHLTLRLFRIGQHPAHILGRSQDMRRIKDFADIPRNSSALIKSSVAVTARNEVGNQ